MFKSVTRCIAAGAVAVILSLGGLANAGSSAAKTDCWREELRGPVSTVVTTFQSLERDSTGKVDDDRRPSGIDAYDRTCTLMERKMYTPDFVEDQHPHRIDATTVHITSNMGDKVLHQRFDVSGNVVESWLWTQDDGAPMLLEHAVHTNDAAGRVVRTDTYDASGKSAGFIILIRDANENIVRSDYRFGKPPFLTQTFTYEFDARGNWIKKVQSASDPEHGRSAIEPQEILYRTITYYS